MNLDLEHVTQDVQPGGMTMEPDYLGYMRQNGYAVNEVRDLSVIPSSSGEKAYLCCRVETTKLPMDSPDLDIVEDETTVSVCTCSDWRYRKSADVSESGVGPQDCSPCKHLKAAYRHVQAMEDDAQMELVE